MKNSTHDRSNKKHIIKLWEPLTLAIICFLVVWLGYYVITFPIINNNITQGTVYQHERGENYLINSPVKIDDDSLRSLKQIDVALRYIEKNQRILADRQGDLVNDVRQESNNIIDKLNLWLSFAIGIVSIFGIFLPLIMERRNTNDIKEAICSMKDKHHKFQKQVSNDYKNTKKDLSEFKKGIKSQLAVKTQKIHSAFKNLENNYTSKKKELDNYAKIQQFRSEFVALSLGFDDRVLSTHPDRGKMLEYLWSKTVESLNNVVSFTKKDNVVNPIDRRLWLMESFVLISSFIIRIRGHIEGRSRDLDCLSDDIRLLLIILQPDNKTEYYWRLVYDQLDKIMAKISLIRMKE